MIFKGCVRESKRKIEREKQRHKEIKAASWQTFRSRDEPMKSKINE